MKNNNKLKPNSVQSTSKQNYNCYISRQVHAEAFKTIYCFIVNIIIKEKLHNVTLTILIIMINKFYMN